MGWSIGSTGAIKGSVADYASLPTPASTYAGQLWFVQNGSGGLLSSLGVYKYPSGLYTPNPSNVWELTPINVKVSEDSTTLVNIINWTEFFAYAFDISVGDRIIYNGTEYKNITGTQIATAPDTDTTNWELTSPEHIVTVAKSGGDFTSIKSAINAQDGVTKTTILVAPGIYTEDNPITCKSEITLKAAGGENTVEVVAQNASQNLFDLVTSFFVQDIYVSGVSGADKYAFSFVSASPGASLLEDVLIENCSNGILLNGASLSLVTRNIAFQGTFTGYSARVLAGNFGGTSLSVVGFSTIPTVVNVSGVNSIATINDIVSFSANVTTGISIQDQSRVVINNSSLVGMTDGVVLEGGCNFRSNALTVFNAQQDGLRINDVGADTSWNCAGCTLKDSTRYDINILSSTALATGTGETNIDKFNFVAGAQLIGAIIDDKEDDEGFNILGELHVGLPEQGYESAIGGGDSYTRGMLVYTETSGNVFADVSDIARSASSSTFAFPGTAIDNAIYIASSLSDVSDVLSHFGIKAKIDTAATIGAGEIVLEYWNGSSWATFNGCTSKSSPGYFKYAKDYFGLSGSYHIKYNPFIIDDWAKNDPMSLGTSYYWVRFRIDTAITTSPSIQQIKLHTNRTEINADGTIEFHSDARVYKKLVVDAVRPLEGNMQNGSIYVDENVGVGLENNRFTTVDDLLGVSFELPEDCDTSGPLIFVWKGKFAAAGSVEFTIRRKIVSPGDAYTNSEPAASGETLTVLTGTVVIGAGNTREDLRVDLDISDAIPSRDADFGDEIWVTIQYSTRGTAGNFDYTKLSANYLSDFNGRHVRQ
jgi:hypothetical protein